MLPVLVAGGGLPDPGTHWEYQSLGRLVSNDLQEKEQLATRGRGYLLALLAYCARNAGRGTRPVLAATYCEEGKVVSLAAIIYESCHIHWPHRGDWASTAAGTIASTNARVYMICCSKQGCTEKRISSRRQDR